MGPTLRLAKDTPASYDLHLHTYWSYDATATPEMYFERAQKLGMRCLAITEHHNIDSVKEVAAVSQHYPDIRVIVAAELTVKTSMGTVDLLCYNLPAAPTGKIAEILEEYHQWQRAAGAAVSRGMQEMGYGYTDEERMKLLESYRPKRAIDHQGATHVRNDNQIEHFIKQGYFSSREDYQKRKTFSTPPYPAVERVVPAVKEAGGIVVIAHPARYFLNDDIKRMDALRAECQLDGIECAHKSVSADLTKYYRQYCLKHDLVSTGGSDSHHPESVIPTPSMNNSSLEPRFARHIGEEEWLDQFLERLDG